LIGSFVDRLACKSGLGAYILGEKPYASEEVAAEDIRSAINPREMDIDDRRVVK
jgi:hypothetical protein